MIKITENSDNSIVNENKSQFYFSRKVYFLFCRLLSIFFLFFSGILFIIYYSGNDSLGLKIFLILISIMALTTSCVTFCFQYHIIT